MIRLITERLILRQYAESDLPEYFKLSSDKQNLYFLDDIITETIEEAGESLRDAITVNEKGTARRFCITIKGDDKLIGAVGYEIAKITPLGKIAEPMGWFIMPEHQNKGYITEAAKAVLDFAFSKDNCVRVATGCYKDNIPTQRVMDKVGFKKEAEKPKSKYHDGIMKDRLEYALNKDEWILMAARKTSNSSDGVKYKGRAQCLVVRDGKILMVKHTHENDEWYCSPGGGIEDGETPAQAALRELREECNVSGVIIKKTSEYVDPYDDENFFYSFHIDIGNQTPTLGYDPEVSPETPILTGVGWMALSDLSEVERVFLWASGLLSIAQIATELESWSREISYPNKRAD